MTADEAYKKILVRYPFQTVQTCLEIDDFYVFFMRPLGLSKKERCLTGTIFPAVKKKWRVFMYDLTTDVDAYFQAKKNRYKNIFDLKVR